MIWKSNQMAGTRNPQRNGKVERKFQTLYGRIRSIFNGAGLEGKLRNEIWAEFVMNATYLSYIISTKSSLKCPVELLYGKMLILHVNLKFLAKLEL
jgi:hypothetical protein